MEIQSRERLDQIRQAAIDNCGMAFPRLDKELQVESKMMKMLIEDLRDAFIKGALWADKYPQQGGDS